MEGQDEFLTGPTDIVKGKRTKRPRSSSPMVAMTSSSSSGCEGGGVEASAGEDYNSVFYQGATTSGDGATEEDEDMAICLIMLAQGEGPPPLPIPTDRPKPERTRKPENSVFECKTCNRSFPSFQALGGHRASHKKPKMEPKPPVYAAKEEPLELPNGDINPLISLSASNGNVKGNKVHECSICGAEFTSGQALGGHMRRHRAANNANQIPPITTNSNEDQPTGMRKLLPLDLNLPAPEDFQFSSNGQQKLVFSAPALVGCHY